MTPHGGSATSVRRACARRQRPRRPRRSRRPEPGGPRFRPAARVPVSSCAEDSHSGLVRTLGKRVGLTPSGVRIPYPPPSARIPTVRVLDPRGRDRRTPPDHVPRRLGAFCGPRTRPMCPGAVAPPRNAWAASTTSRNGYRRSAPCTRPRPRGRAPVPGVVDHSAVHSAGTRGSADRRRRALRVIPELRRPGWIGAGVVALLPAGRASATRGARPPAAAACPGVPPCATSECLYRPWCCCSCWP